MKPNYAPTPFYTGEDPTQELELPSPNPLEHDVDQALFERDMLAKSHQNANLPFYLH